MTHKRHKIYMLPGRNFMPNMGLLVHFRLPNYGLEMSVARVVCVQDEMSTNEIIAFITRAWFTIHPPKVVLKCLVCPKRFPKHLIMLHIIFYLTLTLVSLIF